METKMRLYRCEVKFTYYAYADHAGCARAMAHDAVNTELPMLDMREYTTAEEVEFKPEALPKPWGRGSIVYKEDGTEEALGTLLDALPEKAP